ncbi:hypothetical protein [Phosphitispora fastidiosa]|uniref:hypothetical protein n=1 Tax=Phosphitispora fastidiosa TaxID=2837202 RepID=UPI001E60A1D4|nr:hypothetical protein [Phosphitispora fastidiosa]MBU7007003.1 hypothetical protein [Phosphitispora fastidiosa]
MPKKQKQEATGKDAFNTNNDAEFASEIDASQKNLGKKEATGKAAFNTNNDLNK